MAAIALQQLVRFGGRGDDDGGFQFAVDEFQVARLLEGLVDFIANRDQRFPIGPQGCRRIAVADLAGDVVIVREQGHVGAFGARLQGRQKPPDFVRGESHDGSDQTRQRLGDSPHRRLRRLTLRRGARKGIEAILHDRHIERAQVDDAELNQPLIDAVEEHLVVPLAQFAGQIDGAQQHEPIERFHLIEGHEVAHRVEAVKIAEQIAEGVAHFAVVLGHAQHQGF